MGGRNSNTQPSQIPGPLHAILMKTLPLFKLIFVLTIFFHSCQINRTSEIFLLPENYRGFFYIIYNQPKGQNSEIEKGHRVYDLPLNGVLFTKCKDNPGDIVYENGKSYQTFYTVDENGNKNQLQKFDIGNFNSGSSSTLAQENYSRDSVGIFLISGGIMGDGNSQLTTTKYFIGTYNNLSKSKDISFEYIDSLRIRLK